MSVESKCEVDVDVGDIITVTSKYAGVEKCRDWRVLHVGSVLEHSGVRGLNVWAECLTDKRLTKGGPRPITTGLWLPEVA